MQTQALPFPQAGSTATGAERLTAMVIALGVRDASTGSRSTGRNPVWTSVQARLARIGVPRPQPLADPRLEALRRFAHAAAQGRETESERHDLALAGFSPDAIATAAAMARALAAPTDLTSHAGA